MMLRLSHCLNDSVPTLYIFLLESRTSNGAWPLQTFHQISPIPGGCHQRISYVRAAPVLNNYAWCHAPPIRSTIDYLQTDDVTSRLKSLCTTFLCFYLCCRQTQPRVMIGRARLRGAPPRGTMFRRASPAGFPAPPRQMVRPSIGRATAHKPLAYNSGPL